MRLSPARIFPRPRSSCADAGPADRVVAGEPGFADLDLRQASNRALLSGVMVDEPQRDLSPGGKPTTVLLLSFAVSEERGGAGSALCEVEVADEIAEPHREDLRLGATVLVVGELTGPAGLWADFLAAEPPG